jgi:predicted MFS family arabinose efflux permease
LGSLAEQSDAPLQTRTVIALCTAQVCGMIGYSTVAALLPELIDLWSLTHTQAGWLTAVYFVGYVVSVLAIVSLTDRFAARTIYLLCTLMAGLAYAAFALCDSFSVGLLLRTVAGVGLAGTYMPGLRALSDRVQGPQRARVITAYTVTFAVGVALSFLLAGELARAYGWRASFIAAAGGALLAFAIAWRWMPANTPSTGNHQYSLWDMRPVFANRQAMAYVLAYAAVIWACAGVRQWIVVFLHYSASLQPAAIWTDGIFVTAGLASLLGVPAGIVGNELSLRFGLRRTAIALFLAAALASVFFGLIVAQPFMFVVAVTLVCALVMQGNVSNLTAGTIEAAEVDRMGATMAVHSCIGFCGGIVGPIVFGVVLDTLGADGALGWGVAFASCGIACVLGAGALHKLAKN